MAKTGTPNTPGESSDSHEPGHFADAVVERVRSLGHPLCVGIDPHLEQIPGLFGGGELSPRDPATADVIENFLLPFVDRLEGKTAIVKPQIAFFEQLGARGWSILESVIARASDRGLMVLLDAKRGDIGSTAGGYARAFLAADAACPVDALTVNPYMGMDTLEPFVKEASAHGRGLFVLVKTSNPGSGDLQDLLVQGANGTTQTVYQAVARALSPLASRLVGPRTGWSSLGVVVGATYPEQSEHVRECLPQALFLVPGYGSQGGSAAEAVRSFVPGPAGLEGGLVNSSRGILFPRAAAEASSAADWDRAIDDALDQARNELGEAVSAG